MRFALYGGDRRYLCAADWLARAGHVARLCLSADDCAGADCVLVPSAPPEPDERTRLAERAPGALLLTQRGAAPDDPRWVSLESDGTYMDAIARLTAEAAVFGAMGCRERALFGGRCLVYGYGRIGRALAGILRALRAEVTVAVRGGPSAARAAGDDMPRSGIAEAEALLGDMEFVWNTVPATVLADGALPSLRGAEIVADLASPPYGFSLETALAAGVRARRMPGLPGKYCPETAGEQLARAALRAAERSGR